MSTKPYSWPLSSSSFNLLDKLSIASYVLTQDRYTMGAKVEEFERRFSDFAGARALMFSSGSAANQMVFELWKIRNPGERALVVVPAVTWISSISPAIMAGMDIVFCDVNTVDFSFDYYMLEGILRANAGRRIILWPTALIGFKPDMTRLKSLATVYKTDLYLDSCENTFSDGVLSSCDITTTSCYFSHQVTSCEGGFCFFKNEDDYKTAKMFRNHGLSRSLSPTDTDRLLIEANNPDIDPAFLFTLCGTNMRPTDMHAVFGLRDLTRAPKSRAHRENLYEIWSQSLDSIEYFVPTHIDHSAFCLPLFRRDGNIEAVKTLLQSLGIESRPIIGGNLLRQPPFKTYGTPSDFPVAEWIHTHGCYVGCHGSVSPKMVEDLVTALNDLPNI